MNQKKAKQLRRRSRELMLGLGIKPGEGFNEYEQVKNCISWERFSTPDGKVAVDPDGIPILRPVKNPGTLQLQWKFRLFYKFLKRLYKRGDKDVEKILKGNEQDLLEAFNRS